MNRNVEDARAVRKSFIPEIQSEAPVQLHRASYRLSTPAFLMLASGNVMSEMIGRDELIQEQGAVISKELRCLS